MLRKEEAKRRLTTEARDVEGQGKY